VASGAEVTLPFYRGLLAECLVLDLRPTEALVLVDEALAAVHQHGERHCAPDLHRLRGQLLLAVGGADAHVQAADCWQRGLAEARAMQLPGLALRCATALARLGAGQGRSAEAARLLDELLPVVAAGGASPDTAEAEALRTALAQ